MQFEPVENLVSMCQVGWFMVFLGIFSDLEKLPGREKFS